MGTAADEDFVFNVVWTGTVFPYLQYLVASQLGESQSRFRFVANGCPPDQIELMQEFQRGNADRVVEVLHVSDDMIPHGAALDLVLERRDDGDYFCFVDADILASGPYVADFAARLGEGCAGVTSGRAVWRDDDVLPTDHPGVGGVYFYSPDGFLFGSPSFAMYHAPALRDTIARWGIAFGDGGPNLSDEAKQALIEAGHKYWVYDTAKIVNIFLQIDGNTLCHFEHPHLVHVGGMSHYLSIPETVAREVSDEGGTVVEYYKSEAGESGRMLNRWEWPETRFEVAEFAARVLEDLVGGRDAPEIPLGLDPKTYERLDKVRSEFIRVIDVYGPRVH